MFGLPGKAAVTLTPTAAAQIAKLMAQKDAAGLRIGDEWLLADGQKIPERVLEASLSAHTVLARVTALSEHHAQLAPVAGSKAAVRQHWLAWSAEASP